MHTGGVRIGAALVLIVVAIAAAHAAPAAEQPRRGGSFVVAIGVDPPHLNPHLTTLPHVWMIGMAVYSSLLRLDTRMKPQPELAESWTISQDYRTYTFKLARGVRWHDGRPFTAADVKFTFEQVARRLNVNGGLVLGTLEGVDTPDEHTVIFRFRDPHPALLLYLDIPMVGAILPRHLYEGTDIRRNPANMRPVGTGPFRFVEFSKGSHVTLARNPNYFRRDRPYLDRVVFKVIPDASARVISLENKEVDFLLGYDFALRDVPRLRQRPDVKVAFGIDAAISGAWWLGLNLKREVTGNPKVRRAIAHAIDKNVINERVFFNLGKLATGPVSQFLAGFYRGDVPRYFHDPAKANALLDEAGYRRRADGTRFRLTFIYDTGTAEYVRIAELLREQLRTVGIDLELIGLEFSAWLDRASRRYDFDISRGRRLTGPDPFITLARDFHSRNYRPGLRNWFPYQNARVDQVIDQGIVEADPLKRRQLLFEMQYLIVNDLPNLFLIDAPQPNAQCAGCVGLENDAYGVQRLEEVWISRR